MRLYDIHCHLQSTRFAEDIGCILSRAEEAGIAAVLNAATEPSDWLLVRSLEKYSLCRSALGIHPCYTPANAEQFLAACTDSVFNGITAIGEIGLDSICAPVPLDRQLDIFRRQLSIAKDLKLPAVIHCRGAFAELIQCAKEIGIPYGAAVHAFNGSAELAADLIRHGFDISVGGVLTYRDSRKRAAMLKEIYPDHILFETDAPDIPPAEKKHERNEPSYLRLILAAASEILGVPEEIIAQNAEANTLKLFPRLAGSHNAL